MYRHAEAERGGVDEGPGRKKSRFKALKTRLFGRLKRRDTDGQIKQSQSASDVTAPENTREGYDSEEDLVYPKGTLSSRALSHDSIFLADQAQSSSEPTRVLSQDNVHSKIKALQMKLQQQNFHLGPPPLLIPSKRHEDSGATSEDDGLPRSPPEISFQDGARHAASYKFSVPKRNHSCLSLAGTGSEEEEQIPSQPPSRPLSPLSHPSLRPSSPPPAAASPLPPAADFSTPAQFTSNLDTSAARHRLSVKPRNQRPSNKAKMPSSVYRPRSESMHDLVQVLSEGEEEAVEGACPSEEKSRLRSHSTHIGTTEMERLPLLELQSDSEHSASPDPQERGSFTSEAEDALPSLSSGLQVGEMSVDGEPEQATDPEMHVTVNPLFLQPMPVDPLPEASDITPSPALDIPLPEPNTPEDPLELSVTVDQEENQEEPVHLTEPHTQELENVEETVPHGSVLTMGPETYVENEQSVDGPLDERGPKQATENVSSREESLVRSPISDTSTQASRQVDSVAKYQPVAAPHLKKPPPDQSYTAMLRRRADSSASESEREISAQLPVVLRAGVTPGGQEREMSVDGEIRRPSSGSFSISSARRRSKIVDSGEWNVTNADEPRKPVESRPKTLGNEDTPDKKGDQSEFPQKHKSTLERRRDQQEVKAKESPQKHPFSPEKRTSLRREIVPNGSVSRTVEEKTDVLAREAKVSEWQSRTETAEEKRNAFGVTLRSTSLSLKYRSETAQSEVKHKRHSLEASYMRAISEDLPGSPTPFKDKWGSVMRTEPSNKAFTLGRQPSMSVDYGPPVSVQSGSSTEDLKSKESAAISRLRDRSFRSSAGSAEGLSVDPSGRNQHQPTGPAQPACESAIPETPSQVQLRPLQKTASVATPPKQAAKAPMFPPTPKPTARGAPDRPTSWMSDRTTVERSDWVNMAEEKNAARSIRINDGTPGGDEFKNTFKPAQGSSGSSGSQMSSSPASRQHSAGSQPSWMELAKRKSLAWNDKSLD